MTSASKPVAPNTPAVRLFLLTVALLFLLLETSCSISARQAGDSPGESIPARAKEELLRRAGRFAGQDRLVADFYRIYRKLAYPLPVTSVDNPPLRVEDRFSYPWEIWMIWELEERINSLGWAAEWTGDECFRELAARDLDALAGWEKYNVWENPHLSVGHAARIMTAALDNWSWLPNNLREKLVAACRRLVDNHAEWLRAGRLELVSAEELLERDLLHNIPVIATFGMSMAARAAGHPLRGELERHCLALALSQLEYRERGGTEAVSYDGYVLDFVADWLNGAPEASREAVLSHPVLGEMLAQAAYLALPGQDWNFAPFNDVEPLEMPFHADAHAKFLRWRNDPLSVWYLERFPVQVLRSDGLAALNRLSWPPVAPSAPPSGALDALYAVVLRSGWEADDLAAVVSASNATPGHIQKDNGSIVIGTRGRWLIDDPGYQQYVAGLEREFTLGPNAHNYPLVNGLVQVRSDVTRLARGRTNDGFLHVSLDLTAGYDPSLGLERVTRDVWLRGNNLVVVADRVKGKSVKNIQYTWHGHPEAAWWLEGDTWLIHLGSTTLRMQCPGVSMDGSELVRLPGTRGQVSVVQKLEAESDNALWWVFSLGDSPVECETADNGGSLRVTGPDFSADFSPDK